MGVYFIFSPKGKNDFPKDIYFLFVAIITTLLTLFCFKAGTQDWVKMLSSLLCVASWGMIFLQWFTNERTVEFRKGIFKGKLILNKDSIVIHKKTYPVSEIQKLRITNKDYKFKYQSHKIIGPRLSIGTQNRITIQLMDQTYVDAFFQQDHDNQLVNSEEELIAYYYKGILSKKNLLDVIGSFRK